MHDSEVSKNQNLTQKIAFKDTELKQTHEHVVSIQGELIDAKLTAEKKSVRIQNLDKDVADLQDLL